MHMTIYSGECPNCEKWHIIELLDKKEEIYATCPDCGAQIKLCPEWLDKHNYPAFELI